MVLILLGVGASLGANLKGVCAQDSPTKEEARLDDKEDQMQRLNAAGFEAFSKGNYEEAAGLFDQAYTILADPNLLKNQSLAWFKARRCDMALKYARQFLGAPKIAPKDKKEALAVTSMCNLNRAESDFEQGKVAQANQVLSYHVDPSLLDAPRKKRHEKLRQRIDASLVAQAPQAPEVALEREEGDEGSAPSIGSVLLVSGGAVLLASVLVHVNAMSNEREYKEVARRGEDRGAYDDLGRSLSRDRVLVPVMYGVSAVLIGTGGYLWLQPEVQQSAFNSSNRFTPHGVTLQWHASF